jgi:hypothetical protein
VNSVTHIFTLAASGATPPQDIFTAASVVDEVQVDPSGSYLLFRTWAGIPFSPVTYGRVDVNGGGAMQIWAAGANDNAQAASWLDNGQTIVVMLISSRPGISNWHLGRVALGGSLEMLTDVTLFNRRPFVRRGGSWIVFEAFNPDRQGITVGLMPQDGGGLVMLGSGQPLYPNGGLLTGGLSIDTAERTVALCAGTSSSDPTPQIYIATVGQEVRIQPRIQTGSPFTVELPVAAGELGAVAVSYGLSSGAPLTFPGLQGGFVLDPGAVGTLLLGVGTGGPLTANYQVPANPRLVEFRLFFQGARVGNTGGGFTRWGYLQIF